jgi:3-oxo-5-alpha-steroid 4-dehydrogenase 1
MCMGPYVEAFLFVMGFLGNQISDTMLIRFGTDKGQSYKIPQGFLFKHVSGPNHFCQIMECAGFALMAWNLTALSFLAWTAANLLSRARKHHQWYLDLFPDYPKNRKSIIPFIL